jgi:hypothetical protein
MTETYKKYFKELPSGRIVGDIELYLIDLQENGNCVVDPFYLLNEAVIKSDFYVGTLLKLFSKRKQEFINLHNLDEFTGKLNKLYLKDKITFRPTSLQIDDYIIAGNTTKQVDNTIRLLCTAKGLDFNKSKETFVTFMKSFKKMLQHEVIHRDQMIRIANDKIIPKVFNYSNEDLIKYYSNKQEIMSYAWQIVYDFKIRGKSIPVIKELLSKNSWIAAHSSKIYQEYLRLFAKNSGTMKLLYKYMYQYLE